MKLNWFWTAFILVAFVGGLASMVIGSPEPFSDAMELLLFMGLGKLLVR